MITIIGQRGIDQGDCKNQKHDIRACLASRFTRGKIDILVNPDARTPNEMFPNEMAGKPFPVLKEVKGKAIESDKSKLVNLLIEGDNYHSLAVLNFTHREAVDLIYIDPPYNTGNNDFIYNDKFVDREDSFRHSKWLSFYGKAP